MCIKIEKVLWESTCHVMVVSQWLYTQTFIVYYTYTVKPLKTRPILEHLGGTPI